MPHCRSLRYGPHFFHGMPASRASFSRFCSVTSVNVCVAMLGPLLFPVRGCARYSSRAGLGRGPSPSAPPDGERGEVGALSDDGARAHRQLDGVPSANRHGERAPHARVGLTVVLRETLESWYGPRHGTSHRRPPTTDARCCSSGAPGTCPSAPACEPTCPGRTSRCR